MADEKTTPLVAIPATTEITSDSSGGESTLFGVSVRGIIALLLVITVSVMALTKVEMDEKLFSLVVAVVSFYFGKNSKST